ncbi:MAG: FIG01232333: hypothetical protein [uncultured Gemmatimonadetes bacterium]|uniref:AIPR protein n=1 Tax=uncultured Gemmatimonadota bacterium TaxID=203437 RepID=A0A6J4L9C7_9BACT|nr:MAG: FIG01232333: hypothetical protein [uncultured Gemmatimonadota bacterium]
MTYEQDRYHEYLNVLRSRVNERSTELIGADDVASVAFREEAFTSVVVDVLEELGQIASAQVCYFDRRVGRSAAKVNGWSVDEENGEIELITTLFRGLGEPGSVTATELSHAAHRAVRVYDAARNGYHTGMEPASQTYDMMQRLHQVSPEVTRLRVIVIADGNAPNGTVPDIAEKDLEVRTDVWDLQRLFRADSSGVAYEPIEIDLEARLGAPLPCLVATADSQDYTSYLAVLSGDLLHSLYHDFGARLLELNVRSFLQAKGKVNRGIRDTLTNNPGKFMAYNNGISATAEHVELVQDAGGRASIRSLTGLQIVNGGQTIASVHRAKARDRVDLSDVHVQAKITLVRPEHIETLVPDISRFANTQNKVNEADFSANHPFHVRIQQLSQTIWAPGEQTRWFYERARGQYEVARTREGTTEARLRKFDAATPAHQRFGKIDLAKYLNSWDALPHTVSLGNQKNFVEFMQRLGRVHGRDWEPGEAYYRNLIAAGIVFRRVEKIARKYKFPAYRANAITYTVALLSYRTAGRVDLDRIWLAQDVSAALSGCLDEWMPRVYDEIVSSANGRNVTEWAKKPDCWRQLQTLDVSVPDALECELAAGQALPNVGALSERTGAGLTATDREHIARVMQIEPAEWLHLCAWGAQTQELKEWQTGIAGTLATYAAAGWVKVPSKKQAFQAIEILRIADQCGGRLQDEEVV